VSEAEQIADRFIAEISDGWGEDVERKDKERLAELISAAMDAKDAEILALRAELAEARRERGIARAERDTLLLDAGKFVAWFARYYPEPSQHPDHPWCIINARLKAHDAAIDAARKEMP
jgi:hypothetical protein